MAGSKSGWWSKVKGWFAGGEAQGDAPSESEPAQWLSEDDPANPFDVPILDLMVTQSFIAASSDPDAASRSVSWSTSTGEELDVSPVLGRPAIACELTYPAATQLPDGILYAPPSMDQKWVLAWRDGRVIAARSWTGHVEAAADSTHDGDTLTVTGLRLAESTPLASDNPVEVFDWLIRSHALEQRLPFPLDEPTAGIFEAVPHAAFSPFGNVIFCAARSWAPPPPNRPLRSDGSLIQALRHEGREGLEGIDAAIAAGEHVDSPSTYGGYTALHLSVARGNLASMAHLLSHGADVNRAADGGMFTLGMAIVSGVELEVLTALEEAGANLAATNDDGFGVLHAASEVGRADAVSWLAARGAPLELRTGAGHTAMHIACALGHLDAAKALVAHGADADATSADGQNALDIARQEGREDIVAWLMQR